MNNRYSIIKQAFNNEAGRYISYGIGMNDKILIPDVSTDYDFVYALVDKCNNHNVAPEHIYDIIEDSIGN